MLTMEMGPAGAAAVTHTTIASQLGDLTVVARGGIVVGLYFPATGIGRTRPASALAATSASTPSATRSASTSPATGRASTVPVATNGDEYQERVWSLVRQIPYGETATYGDLARQLGDGTTPQEVGAAVGQEPGLPSRPVPSRRRCAAGKLTGYAGGLSRKRFLLDLEAEVAGRAEQAVLRWALTLPTVRASTRRDRQATLRRGGLTSRPDRAASMPSPGRPDRR